MHEWDYGGYEREVDLPPGYGRGIEASLGSGQLAIRVLRGEPATETLTAQPAPHANGKSAGHLLQQTGPTPS